MSFGMWPSSMWRMWPNQCTWHGLSRVCMVGRPAQDKTSTLVTLSCRICPICSKCFLGGRSWGPFPVWYTCMWSMSRCHNNTCKVLRMQALYTAIFVFTVKLRFDHTWDVGRVSVVTAFLTLLLISVSRERLLVIVDPRYMNWWSESSL